MTQKILLGAVNVQTGDRIKFGGLDYVVVENTGTFIGERELTLQSALLPAHPNLIVKLFNHTVITVKRPKQ